MIRAHTVPKFYLEGFTAPEPDAKREPSVWVGRLKSGEIKRRSPKNLSIVQGQYAGRGAFEDANTTIESHLSEIESAAATAIRDLGTITGGTANPIPPEIWRFLAWQAARTPGWMELVEKWIVEPPFDQNSKMVEPPPEGFERIKQGSRRLLFEEPSSGVRCEIQSIDEIESYRKKGWRLVPRLDDHLEMMHLQAWYFQVRHFPRLSWTRLDAQEGDYFITSDRGVAWLVDGYADTPPAALRNEKAQVVASLTSKVALFGCYRDDQLGMTPREVNKLIAFAATNWIAGSSRETVVRALNDIGIHSVG